MAEGGTRKGACEAVMTGTGADECKEGKRIRETTYGPTRVPRLLCEMTLCVFPY
jgi:hypothetical protein